MPDVHPQILKARALQPLLSARADEANRIRRLTPDVVAALKEGGFFRMLQPASIGGMEMKPSDFSQVTEAIAMADGSTGWVVCQSNGCSMTAAYLDPPVAREMFGPVDGILAWGPPGAPFEAEPVDGGYCASGTWRFASGSQNATWLGAHMRVQGRSEIRTMLFPKTSAVMTDIWHTLGLRGTASNEYTIKDLFIPADHTVRRDQAVDRREQGPLYRFTSNQLYAAGFAGVGLGIARGLIDAFLALPANKVSRGASKPMRENNVVQSQLAQSEARWHSARAFLHTQLDATYDHVRQHGEMTEQQAAMLRLAATWAINQAREAVNTLFHCAGSVAVFEDQPFERRLRDIHTVSQQAQGRQLHYESVGQIMFGMKPENQF
ncbi:acyl-CoA dehydrogenase family protein [Rhodopila sp.]|uniref:acyl-CoA dehydrogenase family protein n=1 Tax=Rhodopila sp. TaxID=2480087 RepID=UPI002C62DF91|nr:acyl-CoA dehydrogenase family protein [Rhodopila sp.]HVZ10343.1 acyl-CoA dehydrogenase family protein [Rhodopila sp.]